MAEIRSDRRAARRAQQLQQQGDRSGGRPQPQRAPATPEDRRRSGPIGFVVESWAELKKVEWPGQNQVVQGTIVVLVACVVVGAFLYANDLVWKHVVAKIIG
jgi:preprotein translocase SecE subunit